MQNIRRVAVLGSGVMGSQIAAHCVNAGLEVTLLDLKSDDPANPNKIADESLKKIAKMKPAPFGLPEYASRIKTGNFEDDFELLDEVIENFPNSAQREDWVAQATELKNK